MAISRLGPLVYSAGTKDSSCIDVVSVRYDNWSLLVSIYVGIAVGFARITSMDKAKPYDLRLGSPTGDMANFVDRKKWVTCLT